ncbi:MAG: alpha-E domain-containing protein [Gemmiger sp.]|uniref:alpha-E domain-containing protein n=1 Tax=Gemmiger sp. TaxID=2049027 RepID=UPI002E75CD95|nr:alpha-E domain-containing protein [Gemmiger sp.]MEE0800675.1 alpha-E domain-containing protein [Gemmiger sp.]
MGTVTLSKQNRLFWLGRYSERVHATIRIMIGELDKLIDDQPIDYPSFCSRLGIPCPYTDARDFCRRYLFDADSPNSVRSCVDAMLGNGIVLRETLSSPTLAYLQMAQSAMELAAGSESPAVALQWVLDDIMAFRGSFDDSVDNEEARNITKAGGLVERLSLMLRLDWQSERTGRELQKLLNRLYKTDLKPQPQAMAVLERCALEEASVPRNELLSAVEGLFVL